MSWELTEVNKQVAEKIHSHIHHLFLALISINTEVAPEH
jgi:hypothetical protein